MNKTYEEIKKKYTSGNFTVGIIGMGKRASKKCKVKSIKCGFRTLSFRTPIRNLEINKTGNK